MSQSNQTTSVFIKKRDKLITLSTLATALTCSVSIALPGVGLLNETMLQAIPNNVAMMMLLLPLAIYCALWTQQEVKLNDYIKEKIEKEQGLARRQLVARIQFKNTHRGTSWEIRNMNPFPWTRTKLLIERDFNGEVECEKYQLDHIKNGEKLVVNSHLHNEETAHWRVMLITDQGRVVEFPDRWQKQVLIENWD